jgi:hypothetical protein
MAEIALEFAEKQFLKFAKAYKFKRGIELEWLDFDSNQKEGWDFRGIDILTRGIIPIQYTEVIVNQYQKKNIEAAKRGEYEFQSAYGIRPFTEAVDEAYKKKLINADKSLILLIGFHDIFYDRNNHFDLIDEIPKFMINKYKHCEYKELWIVNKADQSCDLIF